LVLYFFLSLSGCAGAAGGAIAGEEAEAVVIFSSLYSEGLGQTAGAAWIDNQQELLSAMDKASRQRLGVNPQTPPSMDYAREGVLAIWMGSMPTGGYRIKLASDMVSVKDGTAVVKVLWIEPSEKAFLTQAITSPCIMIKLTRTGFTRIKVVDQKGIIRAETGI